MQSPPQTPPTPPHPLDNVTETKILDPFALSLLVESERNLYEKEKEEFSALCRSRVLRMGNGVFRYSYRSRILKADLVRDSDEKQYFISYQNVLIPSPDVFVKYVSSSSETKSARVRSLNARRDTWSVLLYRGTPLSTFRGRKAKKRPRKATKRRVVKTATTKPTKTTTTTTTKRKVYEYVPTETSCASIVSPTCMIRLISSNLRNKTSASKYCRTTCDPEDVSFIPKRYENKMQSRRSDYARGRLRTDRGRSSLKYSALARQISLGQVDPLSMIRCEHHSEQPFRVIVSPKASFLCDFHAHLSHAEIIGLLCGHWNRDNSTLHIERAFPCRSLDLGGDDDMYTNVEMDPTSELQVREIASREGLQVVGWYHSHPTFQTDPSVRDIENQSSYQRLFRETNCCPSPSSSSSSRNVPPLVAQEGNSVAPFVGLIVGPFDSRLPSM